MDQDQLTRQLSELFFKLCPNTYETTLDKFINTFIDHQNIIIDFIHTILINNPGCLIQLTLIIDISEGNSEFLHLITTKINEWLINTTNYNELLILLINLYLLAKYKFISIESLESFYKLNNLSYISQIINNIVANQEIERSKKSVDEYLNIQIDQVSISCDVVNAVLAHIENLKINAFDELNGDMLMCYHIIDAFIFDKTECGVSLSIYFVNGNFKDMISGIFLYYTLNENKKYALLALFLNIFKVENVLSVFYEMYPLSSNNIKLKEFLNLLMALVYERFFYPDPECQSYYKTSTEYNPQFSSFDKRRYFEILSNESFEILLKISNNDILKYQCRDDQKQDVPIYKLFNEEEIFDLKKIIFEKNYELLKEYSRADFFKTFLVVSRHSVSHFLIYLELLIEFFVMDIEEQRMFCNLIKDVYSDNTSLRKFSCMKLKEFKIIDSAIYDEFPGLFNL